MQQSFEVCVPVCRARIVVADHGCHLFGRATRQHKAGAVGMTVVVEVELLVETTGIADRLLAANISGGSCGPQAFFLFAPLPVLLAKITKNAESFSSHGSPFLSNVPKYCFFIVSGST